jgi:hypothetical protein
MIVRGQFIRQPADGSFDELADSAEWTEGMG